MSRHRPLQAGQRHVRPPGGRRRDHHLCRAARNRCAARATSWPATAARSSRSSAPTATTPRPPARPKHIRRRLSELKHDVPGREMHHRQLRRHRAPARRHARNHAPPRRPRPAASQGSGPQPGGPVGRWNDRRDRKRNRGGHSAVGPAGPWSKRRSRPPCRSKSPCRSSAASSPIRTPRSSAPSRTK